MTVRHGALCVLASVLAVLVTAAGATAKRPASAGERAAILEAVSEEAQGLGVTLRTASISTVDSRFAAAAVGSSAGPATAALRRTGGGWRVLDLGSELGGCARVKALGIPASVVDDLGLARCRVSRPQGELPTLATGVRFAVRPPSVGGWTGNGSGVLGGADGAPNLNRGFGRIAWASWGRVSAVGRGTVWARGCVPDCAGGSWTAENVTTIRAYRLRGRHFTRLTFRYDAGTGLRSHTFELRPATRDWV